MASHLSLPRFLLPQSGRIWRRANLGNRVLEAELPTVRHASTTTAAAPNKGAGKAGKPMVLEKPEKFNPPSHGARLPRKNRPPQQHYGGSLSAEQLAAQRVKDYPGLMPAPGTWARWFLNSRALHLSITMGTLASLAIYTNIQSFKDSSPYTEMLPSTTDFLEHPFISLQTSYEVWRLTRLHEAAVTSEKRKKRVEDVAKRSEYRTAHGYEQKGVLKTWKLKEATDPATEDGEKKKWFGVF